MKISHPHADVIYSILAVVVVVVDVEMWNVDVDRTIDRNSQR